MCEFWPKEFSNRKMAATFRHFECGEESVHCFRLWVGFVVCEIGGVVEGNHLRRGMGGGGI